MFVLDRAVEMAMPVLGLPMVIPLAVLISVNLLHAYLVYQIVKYAKQMQTVVLEFVVVLYVHLLQTAGVYKVSLVDNVNLVVR
jgi:hypothetical protein